MKDQADAAIADVNPVFLIVGALVGSGMGLACGRIPMAYATERRRDGLGLAAMIFCVLFGMLGGCVLAMPVAMVFTVIILALGPADTRRPEKRKLYVPWKPPPNATAPALGGPYSEIGQVIVCNACRQAHQRGPEGIPAACPSCGHKFKSTAAPIPVAAAAASGERIEPIPERRRKIVSWREERRRESRAPVDRATDRPVSARRRIAQARQGDVQDLTPEDDLVDLRPPSDRPSVY